MRKSGCFATLIISPRGLFWGFFGLFLKDLTVSTLVLLWSLLSDSPLEYRDLDTDLDTDDADDDLENDDLDADVDVSE